MLPLAVPILCVIPARLDSARLPRKPLRLLAGEPLIRHVARRAAEAGVADRVIVASDRTEVLEAVAGLPVDTCLTSGQHASGTERVAEVAARGDFAWADVILNVQGDEPFFPVEGAVGALREVEHGRAVGTVGGALMPAASASVDRVKVVVDRSGRALRFSRAQPGESSRGSDVSVLEHVGMYAYTREILQQWVGAGPLPAESTEGLEQLRPLALGMSIGVARLDGAPPPAVDTPADLERAERYMDRQSMRVGP